MKNRIILLLLLTYATCYSQAPHKINYQGVARNSSGSIITSGNIGLKFRILQGSPTGTVAYEETNTATPNSTGIFTVAIGGGTPVSGSIASIIWASGPYFIEVNIDPTGGTSYTTVGLSQLLSVPYALYAEKSGTGGGIPSGTVTGQTLYWNQTSGQWIINSNLINNGSNVNVGDPVISNNKMKVVSTSNTDSAALFVYKPNSIANQAAVRGFASGSATNSGSLTINPIAGGHFIGFNLSPTGSAVGLVGQGISPLGDAVGLIGVASSSASSVGRSVGLYASSTGPNYPTSFAAIFDRGKVFVNDTLIINTSGNIGDVLTRGVNGKSYWSPGASTAAGPWGQAVGSVTLTNTNDNVLIGTTSSASKVNIGTSVGFAGNDVQVTSLGSGDALQLIKPLGVGAGLRVVNASSTSTAVATISSTSGNPLGLEINIAGNSAALSAISNGTAPAVTSINNSNGPSVRGTKSGVGVAGLFDVTVTGSSSDALVGSTIGTGAAVHAMTGTLTTSALSLLVEGGHVRAMGPPIGVATVAVTGGFAAVASPTCIACNDVRGVVSFSTSVTGFSTTNYAEVTINFAKPYSTVPNINLTPLSDMQDLSYVVSNPTTTSFSIRIYRSTNKTVPVSVPSALFKFNYIVIE